MDLRISRIPVDMRWPSDVLDGSSGVESWRAHYESSPASHHIAFDELHWQEVTNRVNQIRSSASSSPGPFDTPLSPGELLSALRLCQDSATGIDGLPYSAFKVDFGWWQAALLDFFELLRVWCMVPSQWHLSLVSPLWKRGDHRDSTNYKPIVLAGCMLKIFEPMINKTPMSFYRI